jgi:NitT/TauT family transport system substrate-binding protein
MKRLVPLLAILVLALAACGRQPADSAPAQAGPAAAADTKKSFRIAWSRYTGWEPWALAEKNGILKKWADQQGIAIELVFVDTYVDSIERYSKGEFDGCAMTNVDALTLPAAAGVDSTALIIGDYSNGNDGIVVAGADSVTALQGRSVHLVENSVSQFLLARALQINGIAEDGIRVADAPEAEIGARFAADAGNAAAATWNPHLSTITALPDTHLVFDSSDIQGEILDLMVVRSDSPETLKNALVGAWYETLALLVSDDPGTRRAAIEFMAGNSGVSVAEFEQQLLTTAMFYFPWDGASFANSASVADTIDRARDFGFRNGLFGAAATSPDAIGVELGDGSVRGDPDNVKLRFVATYMQRAALRSLD